MVAAGGNFLQLQFIWGQSCWLLVGIERWSLLGNGIMRNVTCIGTIIYSLFPQNKTAHVYFLGMQEVAFTVAF